VQKEVAETASKKVPAKNSTSSLNHVRKNKLHEIILSNLPSRPDRIRLGKSADERRRRGSSFLPRSHSRRPGLGQTRRQRKHRNLLLRHRQTLGFLNNPVLVGIYITSHNTNTLSAGTIDNFSITPTPAYRLQDQDTGAPALMGCANLTSGVWTISGSGADIWGTADQFNFQPWLVWGNCTVICRITSLSTTGDPWQKIGIMVRDGYNSGSDYALFCATAAQGVDYQYRLNFNNNNDAVKYIAPPAPGTVSGVVIGTGLTGAFQGPYTIRP
jgi:hypothetical protein